MGCKWIDHKNGNGLDNQKGNLRKATRGQNRRNSNSSKNSTSKFKGVSWDKAGEKWRANIYLNGKLKHLGLFTDEIEAARIYNKYTAKHFNEFGKLNIL